MRFLRAALDTLKAADIHQICLDQVAESTEVEFKQDLPARADRGRDPWHEGAAFGEYARNAIAEEIVAFANTLGGAVLIGIEESDDHPKRARKIIPIPRVHELARRLRQAVYDVIDPPLPMLEAVGIPLADDGTGVVVLRVPASRRRPHRLQSNREVYIRREDETARIGMRQIQELTIQSFTEARRVDDLISERRSSFCINVDEFSKGRACGGFHIAAVPTVAIDLGRVTKRAELTTFTTTQITAKVEGRDYPCEWPFSESLIWKPALRSITAERSYSSAVCRYRLGSDGVCELSFFYLQSESQRGFFIQWLVAAYGQTLAWVEAVRTAAGTPVEIALAPQLIVRGDQAVLQLYGSQHWTGINPASLPIGLYKLPIASVAGTEEFSQHLISFNEDLWSIAGRDSSAPTFEVTLPALK